MDILKYIPKGRENAITRQQLCNLTGWSDRRVRKEIETLRREGYPILSFSEGPGYWYSGDIEEIERYLKEVDSRSRSGGITNAKLRRVVAQAKGYYEVPVRAHMRRIKRDKPLEGQERF